MTATTIVANPVDTPTSVSVAAGGTPGGRGVSIIVDWSKVESQTALITTLETIKRRLTSQWPVPNS